MDALLKNSDRAKIFLEALPYIQSFRNKTVVIKYGGSAMENEVLMGEVLREVVFLEAVGINPVIVHGGGKEITHRMKEKNLQAQFIAGLRVTDAAAIQVVEEVLDRNTNPRLAQKIIAVHGKAKSVSGRTVFHAKKAEPLQIEGKSFDLGFVGDVVGCHAQVVEDLIHHEIVPVISPLGQDEHGQVYNINADIAAAEIAIAIHAHKIIYISDVNGILIHEKDPSSTIPTVNEQQVAELKQQGVISGGMLPKVDASLRALKAGIQKIHLIDGKIPNALLLELFTDAGIGTEIVR